MKRQFPRTLLFETAQAHVAGLFTIVENILDDTEFNKKTKDQILLAGEMIKKSILLQPKYQNESSSKLTKGLNQRDL